MVVPTHFLYDGTTTVRLHLAKPNPVWAALRERPRALLTVVGDWAYVPSDWQAAPGTPRGLGIPTSYYATVQLSCDVEVVDDPEATAAILRASSSTSSPPVATWSRTRRTSTTAAGCRRFAGWC